MSLAKQLRRMAFKTDRVQRLSKFRKINVSNKLRSPKLIKYIRQRVFQPLIDIVVGEATPVVKTNLGIESELTEQNLVFTAKRDGRNSNLLSMAIVDEKTDGSAEVVVKNQHLVILIEDGVTTFDTIVAAIESHELASRLVSVDLIGLGTETATVMSSKLFTSGR